MTTTELILYACPTGPLAECIERYFDALATRPTAAQRYPPHCTLTGFFHDEPGAIPAYVEAAGRAADESRRSSIAVDVTGLRTDPDCIGLTIVSPGLERLTEDFAERVADVPTRIDDIRVKDWLHVSLAYGHAADAHDEPADLAQATVDATLDAGWELRLYERRAGDRWTVHGTWPLVTAFDATRR